MQDIYIYLSFLRNQQDIGLKRTPEAFKSLYRSPGYKKNKLVLCKNYVLQWYSSWNSDQHKKHKVCKGPSND